MNGCGGLVFQEITVELEIRIELLECFCMNFHDMRCAARVDQEQCKAEPRKP